MTAFIAVNDPDQAARTYPRVFKNSAAALRTFWFYHIFLLVKSLDLYYNMNGQRLEKKLFL